MTDESKKGHLAIVIGRIITHVEGKYMVSFRETHGQDVVVFVNPADTATINPRDMMIEADDDRCSMRI